MNSYLHRHPQFEVFLGTEAEGHVVIDKEDWEQALKSIQESKSNYAHFTEFQIGEKVYAILTEENKPGFIVQISIRERECIMYEVSFGSGESKWFHAFELSKEFTPKV